MNNSLFALFALHTIHYDFICCASESISDLFHLIFYLEKKERQRRKKTKTLNVEPGKPIWTALDDEVHGFQLTEQKSKVHEKQCINKHTKKE